MTEYIKLEDIRTAFGIGADCADCPHRTDDCCLESRPTAAICDIINSFKPEYREAAETAFKERDYYRQKLSEAAAENAKLRAIIDKLRDYAEQLKEETQCTV